MQRGFSSKFFSLLFLTVGSFYLLYPTYAYFWKATPEQREDNKLFCESLPSWMLCKKLTLGLDLQGGLHLVMGVVVEKAVSDRASRLSDVLADQLKEKALPFESVKHLDDTPSIQLTLKDAADEDKVRRFVRENFSVFEVTERQDGGKLFKLSLIGPEQKRIKDEAVEQAIKTIRNRADKYGVSEPTIARRGEDNILIQLPGVKDPDRAIDIIGRTAQLQFQMVDDKSTAFESIELPAGVTRDFDVSQNSRSAYLKAPTKEAIFEAVKGHVPDDRSVKVAEERDQQTGKLVGYRSYMVEKKAGITGDYLTDTQVSIDNQDGRHYVSFNFDAQGAKIFEKLTGENVGNRMAIVLDDVVDSAPVIQTKIPGGSGRISLGGYKTQQEILADAKALALVLKSGALAAPVVIREQRRVGATLGSEAVKKGQQAMLVGLFLVVLAMIVYYRVSGAIADFALIFNFLFILAILAYFEATLTLPGMAGIALTLGMAVDANVIILERIREELRHGKTVRAAIEAGYDRAFMTIVDSHVTQVIAGVILLQYGTGAIRGFAITLVIGIAASLYTSVVITKMVYEFMMSTTKMERISI